MRSSTNSSGFATTPGSTAEQRDRAVDEFIELVAAVDGILQSQAQADAAYFAAKCGRPVDEL